MRFLMVGLLLAVCALRAMCASAGEAVALPRDIGRLELISSLTVALDPRGDWTIADAAAAAYRPAQAPRYGFLAKSEALWIKTTLVNTSQDTVTAILDTGDYAPDRIDVFAVEAGTRNVLSQKSAGSALPFQKRELKSHTIAFPLALPPQRSTDLYLRIQSATRVQIAPVLYSVAAFHHAEHRHDAITYAAYGGVIALILYHLIISLASRDMKSLHFVGFMIVWAVYSALLEGVLLPFLPHDSALFRSSHLVAFSVFPVIAIAVLISLYLQPTWWSSRWNWALAGLCAISVIVSLLVVGEWAPFRVLRLAAMVCVIAAVVANAVVCGAEGIAGDCAARFYFAGSLLMLVFLLNVVRIFVTAQGLYTDVDIWLRLSCLAPLALFAVGHGERIRQLTAMHGASRRQAAHALEQTQFKSNFLAKMSHEIRTPMNGVLGPVELLQRTPLTAEQAKYVNIAATSAHALLSVVNDILDYSKLEAGKLSLQPATFSLRDLLDECAAICSVYPGNPVRLEMTVADDVPAEVHGDAQRLRQVLINLINNALKFTREGSVRINVTRGHGPNSHMLEFAVIDTGVGIAAQDLDTLFSRYRQIDAGSGGTGLGLAICKELVELMQGSIEVSSQLGAGSTFRFRIPIQAIAAS